MPANISAMRTPISPVMARSHTFCRRFRKMWPSPEAKDSTKGAPPNHQVTARMSTTLPLAVSPARHREAAMSRVAQKAGMATPTNQALGKITRSPMLFFKASATWVCTDSSKASTEPNHFSMHSVRMTRSQATGTPEGLTWPRLQQLALASFMLNELSCACIVSSDAKCARKRLAVSPKNRMEKPVTTTLNIAALAGSKSE
mmetsp:Transcript_23058/g.54800  ORF Transcript_23058/g.54800 Transcript_23058/m.54800 type:complete len:201 (-) Transcript_23058:472-1074(-)